MNTQTAITQKQLLKNNIIDTRILPKQDSRILFEFFEFLKNRERNTINLKQKKRISFHDWALNSTNKLTRKEIYGYL